MSRNVSETTTRKNWSVPDMSRRTTVYGIKPHGRWPTARVDRGPLAPLRPAPLVSSHHLAPRVTESLSAPRRHAHASTGERESEDVEDDPAGERGRGDGGDVESERRSE